MKTILLGFILFYTSFAAFAENKAELDDQVHTLTAKFEAFQQRPEKAIPADLLRKAEGIILLDRTKAGFIFAYQGGGGVALVKDGNHWSPPAFLKGSEASLGFQIGGEQNFFIILLMNTNATHKLIEPKYNFGGEARGTAGDASSGVEGNVQPETNSVIIYTDRQGLYGGAAIKGGALTPDDKANRTYYKQVVSMTDILFNHKVESGEAGANLAAKINDYASRSSRNDKK